MNHTEQAKHDLAMKMLKGQIEVEEVAMISGLPVEVVQKMRDDQDSQERAALGGYTVREMGVNDMIIDNELLDDDN